MRRARSLKLIAGLAAAGLALAACSSGSGSSSSTASERIRCGVVRGVRLRRAVDQRLGRRVGVRAVSAGGVGLRRR